MHFCLGSVTRNAFLCRNIHLQQASKSLEQLTKGICCCNFALGPQRYVTSSFLQGRLSQCFHAPSHMAPIHRNSNYDGGVVMLRYWRKCSCALILAELLNCVLAPKTSMQLCAPQVVALHSHPGRRCSYASHAQESGGWCGGGGAGGGGRSIPCHAEVTFSGQEHFVPVQLLAPKHVVSVQLFVPKTFCCNAVFPPRCNKGAL